jgi:hypothetical protein
MRPAAFATAATLALGGASAAEAHTLSKARAQRSARAVAKRLARKSPGDATRPRFRDAHSGHVVTSVRLA